MKKREMRHRLRTWENDYHILRCALDRKQQEYTELLTQFNIRADKYKELQAKYDELQILYSAAMEDIRTTEKALEATTEICNARGNKLSVIEAQIVQLRKEGAL